MTASSQLGPAAHPFESAETCLFHQRGVWMPVEAKRGGQITYAIFSERVRLHPIDLAIRRQFLYACGRALAKAPVRQCRWMHRVFGHVTIRRAAHRFATGPHHRLTLGHFSHTTQQRRFFVESFACRRAGRMKFQSLIDEDRILRESLDDRHQPCNRTHRVLQALSHGCVQRRKKGVDSRRRVSSHTRPKGGLPAFDDSRDPAASRLQGSFRRRKEDPLRYVVKVAAQAMEQSGPDFASAGSNDRSKPNRIARNPDGDERAIVRRASGQFGERGIQIISRHHDTVEFCGVLRGGSLHQNLLALQAHQRVIRVGQRNRGFQLIDNFVRGACSIGDRQDRAPEGLVHDFRFRRTPHQHAIATQRDDIVDGGHGGALQHSRQYTMLC